MAYFLRPLKQGRWLAEHEWLSGGDVAADSLLDLLTAENRLSVWEIDDECTNLNDVIAAIASTRHNIVNFDYVLIPGSVLERLKIEVESTIGTTGAAGINGCHRDLVKISARVLAALACAVRAEGGFNRVPQREVARLVKDQLDGGKITDLTRVGECIRDELPRFSK